MTTPIDNSEVNPESEEPLFLPDPAAWGADTAEWEAKVEEVAMSQISADAWMIAHPDDPRMRAYLIDDEGFAPEFADRVLERMRELDRSRPKGWDRFTADEAAVEQEFTSGGDE